MFISCTQVVELVDTPDLGSGAARCEGSSPFLGILFFFLLLIFFSTTDASTRVFVITVHVRNEEHNMLWRRCYSSIREFYPDDPIVIIEDNSPLPVSDESLHNTKIIRSKFPGDGEFLPYYYFLKYSWADKMIFLHDSMFLRRPFTNEELNHPIKFHWHFEDHRADDDRYINFLLLHLKEPKDLISYNKRKHLWYGCFGATSIIDLKLLKKIEKKYAFTNLINLVINRSYRMAVERVFAILLFKENFVRKNNCSNFGCIHDYPDAFQNVDEELLEDLKSNYPGAILKTWHGR